VAGQGRYMPVERIRQVIHLLTSTEMTVKEIAERMSCSRSVVRSINRKFQIREYNGRRSRWVNESRKSARQRDVLQLMAEGKTMKEAANLMGISIRTAESHKYEMMRLLGVKTTAALIRYAVRINLV
jgi:DNA-binding CsgD family transcriptional regulator